MAENLPITAEQYAAACEILSNSGKGLSYACKEIGISYNSFYKYQDMVGASAEKLHARARSRYIECKLLDRDALNAKALKEIKGCDPKRVNALQNYYKELARQIEWELTRLLPGKYGDKVEVNNNIRTPTALKVNIIDPKAKV